MDICFTQERHEYLSAFIYSFILFSSFFTQVFLLPTIFPFTLLSLLPLSILSSHLHFSFFPAFFPSFLPSFIPSFLLSFFPSFLPSLISYLLPSFLPSSLPFLFSLLYFFSTHFPSFTYRRIILSKSLILHAAVGTRTTGNQVCVRR